MRLVLSSEGLASAIPSRWRWPISIALVIGGIVYAFASLHARVRQWNDFAFIFAAGRTWLQGASPYDFERWNAQWAAIRPPETVVSQPMPYMYPPHWGPIAVSFAAMPWPVASRVWDAISVVAYGATVAFAARLLGDRWTDEIKRPAFWAFVAFATFNPAMRYSIDQSQMTMVAMLGLVGAFWAWHDKRLGWLVVFGFVAALKPQLSVLGLAYLFLNGGHLGVCLAAASAAAVGLLSMLPSHLGTLPAAYAHCYLLHMQLDFNDPKNFAGLPALFATRATQHAFMPVSTLLAVAAAVALTAARRVDAQRLAQPLLGPLWQLAVVVAITGAFMPVHTYDLVLYTPVVMLAYQMRSTWFSPWLVGLVFLAGRTKFFAARLHVFQASSYLTTAILLTLVVAWLEQRDKRQPRASSAANATV